VREKVHETITFLTNQISIMIYTYLRVRFLKLC